MVDAFQVPLEPLRDSSHLGNRPGQIIEHASGGDFPAIFFAHSSGQLAKTFRRRISQLEAQVEQLKAANELLRRFADEKESVRLRLLRVLRHECSEAVIRTLAQNLRTPIEKVATNSVTLELLIELSRSGYIAIENAVVSVTGAGEEFFQKLCLKTRHAT